MAEDLNHTDPRPADGQNNLLAKILRRLRNVTEGISPGPVTVELTPGDIEVGAVEIKNATTDDRAAVQDSAPVGTEQALVTRNIPSGFQRVRIEDPLHPADIAHVSGMGALLSASIPIGFQIASEGEVAHHEAYMFHIMGRRAGFNSTSILQDVGEFITGNAFPTPLTGAEALEVISSSTDDDNTPPGIGALKVKITYINALGNLVQSAAIALNGLTAVATGITALQILWMEVSEVGTVDGVAVGNITLRTTVGTVAQELITAGGNRSMAARFMVPAGFKGYLLDWDTAALGTATQDVRLRATCETFGRVLTNIWIFQDNTFLAAGTFMNLELPFLRIPALGRVKVSTISSQAQSTNRVDAGFTVVIVADP